jgi:hypothetical protein
MLTLDELEEAMKDSPNKPACSTLMQLYQEMAERQWRYAERMRCTGKTLLGIDHLFYTPQKEDEKNNDSSAPNTHNTDPR